MAKSFMPEQRTRDELFAFQLEGLKWTVNHAYTGSAHYRKKFE